MGIPSFYRHLCRRYPRIIGGGAGRAPEWLCLDFNCAMYHVLRSMRPVSAAGSQGAWETEFADAIAAYMRRLVELAGPTRGVYVSCDGVVCAAKRRQQRLRRFRGPWFAAAEAAARGVAAEEGHGWDQNALTPGTAFMEQLGGVLEAMGRRLAAESGGSLDVRVSTTAEPGEGEHKLLAAMRGLTTPPRTVTIYGLDADLILLAALLQADTGAEVLLMREAQEFERGGAGGGEAWKNLNVRGLVEAVIGDGKGPVENRVRDWVAAMSLLGNDFLPRSLTRTVRDDGIPALLRSLRSEVWSEGRRIVEADGQLSRDGLLALLRVWAATELGDMDGAVRAAQKAAGAPLRGGGGALEEWQAQPARWCSLGRLASRDGGGLNPQWRRVYREAWRAGPVGDYLAGLAWVWDYYSGRPVCRGWCYDHHLPPLWGDLVAGLEGMPGESSLAAPPVRWSEPLPAWTHLLSVLPAESVVRLLPVSRGARFVAAEPWWWPASWSLFDVGRSQMWECEAVLPLVPEETLRRWAGGA
jgi:5'-3' exonuclease